MKTRPLGPSGIDASVIALGAWAIGGWMWGGTTTKESIRTVHTAIDLGMNLIDTAPVYGFGISENIVGEAIRDRRDQVVLATKCGMVCNTTGGVRKFRSNASGPDENGHLDVRIYLHPDSIREEIEASLRRLQTDYIDLYQTHNQDTTTPIEDTMATLLDLKQEGKIRAIGASNANGEQLARYQSVGPLDADQENFSMISQEAHDEKLPFCREYDVAFLAYSPLARGLLSGNMGPDRQFKDGDQRQAKEKYGAEGRARATALLESMRPVADKHGLSLPQLVLAWTHHQPGVTHVLAGARTPEQATENAVAGDAALDVEDLAFIDERIRWYEKQP